MISRPRRHTGTSTSVLRRLANETARRAPIITAILACILFGCALIANVQLSGEGSWYWYAKLARNGARLYSDLNIPLQPLFPLETEWVQNIFGERWLSSKIPALFHLIGYATALFVLVEQSSWTYRQKAIVFTCAFLFGIQFEAYRFDDYHVFCDTLCMFVAALVLRLADGPPSRQYLGISAALGVLSAISLTTRLNDGISTFAFCALSIVVLPARNRAAALAVLGIAFAAVVVTVVSLTGDSLVEWATKSVLHVDAIKGGDATFLSDPAKIIQTAWTLISTSGWQDIVAFLSIAALWVYLVAPLLPISRTTLLSAAFGVIGIGIITALIVPRTWTGDPDRAVLAVGMFVAYAVALYVIIRLLRDADAPGRRWNPREIVLLLPFAMAASGSLSSAGSFSDLYASIAVLIILLPVIFPIPIAGHRRSILLVVCSCVAIAGAMYRYNDPASWISYRTNPLFVDRKIINHPIYGPMVIDKNLLGFISRVCPLVNNGNAKPELLSVPWPYVNYFCHIPPWHGYVQTWFDTTPRFLAYRMLREIENAPPEWIMYQRQIGTLAYHEYLYNGGQALPQRTLDEFVMKRVSEGQWKVAFHDISGPDSEWLLVNTRYPVSYGANLLETTSARRAPWTLVEATPTWSLRPDGITARHGLRSSDVSTIVRPVKITRGGPIAVGVGFSVSGARSDQGEGISAELVNKGSNTVVGILPLSATEGRERTYAFRAVVLPGARYELRIHYGAERGSVRISAVEAVYDPSSDVIGDLLKCVRASVAGAGKPEARCVSLSDSGEPTVWRVQDPEPVWVAGDDGVTVSRLAGSASESMMVKRMHFAYDGTIVVGARIGASVLEMGDGYGYAVEVYDETAQHTVGSLSIPAIISEPRNLSFVASVQATHKYQLRLMLNAAMARVNFSNLKVEFGTETTFRSSELNLRKAYTPNSMQ